MGTTAERLAQRSSQNVKSKAFIGFDEDTLIREFDRAMKELDALANSVQTKHVRSIQRASLKPMVERYKANIKNETSFKVFRYGGVYAEIPKGTLKKSIGIISTPVRKHHTFSSLSVGARVKGAYKDPEKGGWFAHFVEYGFINKYGQYIRSKQNFGFAERAQKGGLALVRNTFKNKMKAFLEKQLKASKQ